MFVKWDFGVERQLKACDAVNGCTEITNGNFKALSKTFSQKSILVATLAQIPTIFLIDRIC